MTETSSVINQSQFHKAARNFRSDVKLRAIEIAALPTVGIINWTARQHFYCQ
jgi:hypothetical protein